MLRDALIAETASDDVQRGEGRHGRVQLPGGQTASALLRQEVVDPLAHTRVFCPISA